MHRHLPTSRLGVASLKKSSFLPPFVLGLCMWVGFPTMTAYQDMGSLVSGIEAPGARWSAVVDTAVAGSVHVAEMPFASANMPAGTISGSGMEASGIGAVAFKSKKAAISDIPDEDRITRSQKQGRIVNVAPVAPPKAFNAGSVLDRTSSLLRPAHDGDVRMAFAKSPIKGKEIEIATAFYLKKNEKPAAQGVPTMLAGLVNNDKADILATAYAPAEPDYAKASPFASLLKDEGEAAGRFIPPVTDGDHDWMRKPLPAAVFSKGEQKCLATAIYFEARGESLKGQAAVAQVILNRVRNPAYPGTICGVVYQNQNWHNRCQFSFACDGIKDRITSRKHYEVAEEIAMAVTAGKIFIPSIGSSTHYYAAYVSPGWARTMEKMKRIGLHIFYRTYGGGWS